MAPTMVLDDEAAADEGFAIVIWIAPYHRRASVVVTGPMLSREVWCCERRGPASRYFSSAKNT